jgi:hypothetical protein
VAPVKNATAGGFVLDGFNAAWDLMSWSFLLIRFEVVARGPFGPGFLGFFTNEQSKLAFWQLARIHQQFVCTFRTMEKRPTVDMAARHYI